MKKFPHLDVPYQWEDYWTRYPHGYSIFEALSKWVTQVDDMVDNINEWNKYLGDFVNQFDKELQGTVVETLKEWQESGFLDVVINSALQTHIDKIDERTKGIVNIEEFNRLPGESTDTNRIKRALSYLDEFGQLVFSGGIIEIDEPIIINKKNITLTSNGFTTIKPVKNIGCCIKFEAKASDTIVTRITVENLVIDADYLTDYCILVQDDVGLYASDLLFNNIRCRRAKKDGLCMYGPVWQVKIEDSYFEYNGRDGIRGAMDGNLQINTVKIDNVFCTLNGEYGIHLNGTKHTIKNSTIERNKYGIGIDTSMNKECGFKSPAYKISIMSNYLELNQKAQVFLHTVPEKAGILAIDLYGNYFLSGSDTGPEFGESLVLCGGGGFITGTFKDNYYYRQGKAIFDIDGGGVLDQKTTIYDTDNCVNLKYASVKKSDLRSIVINQVDGINFDPQTQTTDNIITEVGTKKIGFSVGDLENRVLMRAQIYIETDATTYSIRFWFILKNAYTGKTVKSNYLDFSKNSSALISCFVVNEWGDYRIKKNEYVYCKIEVLDHNGSYLKAHKPFVHVTS